MIEEIKNIKSGRRELRQFGITIGVILGLLGCFFIWRQKEWCYYFIIISFVFLLFGLVLPLLLKPVHKVWMTLAIFMGWCMTGVILGVLFYLVVTPIGLLMRLCGKDFLDRKFDSTVQSYWVQRKAVKSEKRNYENQF
jgi:hypothetical protein